MRNFSIIQKSQLEGTLRLDAEYYQPEYLELVSKIQSANYGFQALKEIDCKVVSGPFGSSLKSDAYLDSGVPFVRISNLQNFFIDNNQLVYISEENNNRLKQSQLFPSDLILSKVGNTIGVVSVVPEEFKVCNISENNIGIKFNRKNQRYRSFLLVFLNSKLGFLQIIRRISGNAQPKLNIQDIYDLIFPIPTGKILRETNNIVMEAKRGIDESKLFYSQAENLLLEKLGLAGEKFEDELSYVVDFSKVQSNNRIDADYFQPKYEKLISKIKNKNPKLLLDVVENVPAEFRPQSQPERGFEYVELANINSSIGIVDGSKEVLGREAPSRAKRLLEVDDVIISSVEGSLGKVALIGKEQEGYLASTGFFQFRSKEVLPEFLLALSKSIVLQMQLKKECTGTILTAVPKESVKNILIPVLSKPTQQKIANLVRQSHEAHKKAKQLLEKAKREVEKMIEKEAKK